MKSVFVGILCLCMLLAMGCGGNVDDRKEEATNKGNVSEDKTEQDIVEEHYYSDYSWTLLEKRVDAWESNSGPDLNGYMNYGRFSIDFDPLFEEEAIAQIEYHIENGNGYFMDRRDFFKMNEDEQEKKCETLTQWDENGYTCSSEEQQGVFFTIYYKHDVNLSRQQKLSLKRNAIRKVSIVINLKYKDGTEQQHRYAFDFPYDFNYTNVDIYELTKE